MSKKLYLINADSFKVLSAEAAKLPKQQQIILKTMLTHCVESAKSGTEVIELAIKNFGLETRQKPAVLYAWYARSNEGFGVSVQSAMPVTLPPVPAKTKSESKTK